MACFSRFAVWKVVRIIRYGVYRQHGVLISVYTINSYNRSLKQDNECVIITILTGGTTVRYRYGPRCRKRERVQILRRGALSFDTNVFVSWGFKVKICILLFVYIYKKN